MAWTEEERAEESQVGGQAKKNGSPENESGSKNESPKKESGANRSDEPCSSLTGTHIEVFLEEAPLSQEISSDIGPTVDDHGEPEELNDVKTELFSEEQDNGRQVEEPQRELFPSTSTQSVPPLPPQVFREAARKLKTISENFNANANPPSPDYFDKFLDACTPPLEWEPYITMVLVSLDFLSSGELTRLGRGRYVPG